MTIRRYFNHGSLTSARLVAHMRDNLDQYTEYESVIINQNSYSLLQDYADEAGLSSDQSAMHKIGIPLSNCTVLLSPHMDKNTFLFGDLEELKESTVLLDLVEVTVEKQEKPFNAVHFKNSNFDSFSDYISFVKNNISGYTAFEAALMSKNTFEVLKKNIGKVKDDVLHQLGFPIKGIEIFLSPKMKDYEITLGARTVITGLQALHEREEEALIADNT